MANKELSQPIKATKEELSAKMRKLKVIYDLPKIDINDDQQVEDRIDYYLEYSAREGLKPTVEGLALAIGVSRKTLYDWETGYSRAESSQSRSDIIKKAKDFIAYLMSDFALDGKIFPATWIFYAKNYFGMKDTQDIQITPNNALGDQLSPEEIAKRIPEDIPVDVDYTEE